MEISADYVIVGSGLTGAVIARLLTDAGREVLVLERRAHVGGNVHDHDHPSGIRIHTYGPHYFRTNSEKIWDFVRRFASFYHYEASLKSFVDGNFENWPIAGSYIRRTVGENWTPGFSGTPRNFEEASLAMMPTFVYEKFVRGYTQKQWGVHPSQLDATLARRFDVRLDDEPRLMRHMHQGLPSDGYTSLMTKLLGGIPLMLNIDYLHSRESIRARKLLVFTGPIDEFFDFDIGRLKYRGQVREERWYSDENYRQPCGQVNNPQLENGPHIRTLEWKHMMPRARAESIRGTVVTTETTVTPDDPNHYEYPFPDSINSDLFRKYEDRARCLAQVLICGRLGEYRYYDMDQAIGRAMMLAQGILDTGTKS